MKVKELLVVSGKGGTGKTSIVGSFAVLAKDKVLADCDVDAADLHLLLKPHIRQTNEFYGSKKPVIDYRKCNGCGICAESCRFEAIDMINTSSDRKVKIEHITCEGCGAVSYTHLDVYKRQYYHGWMAPYPEEIPQDVPVVEEEMAFLKQQAEILKSELKAIEKRLEDLSSVKDEEAEGRRCV